MNVDIRPPCVGDPIGVTPEEVVPNLQSEWAVDLYDVSLYLACRVGREPAYFVFSLTGHYEFPF